VGRPAANETVVPRKPIAYMPAGVWKVTARYRVRVSATRYLECVRVRGPYASSNSVVLHFSVSEFNKLFKETTDEGCVMGEVRLTPGERQQLRWAVAGGPQNTFGKGRRVLNALVRKGLGYFIGGDDMPEQFVINKAGRDAIDEVRRG
jgi:hypothetical protein